MEHYYNELCWGLCASRNRRPGLLLGWAGGLWLVWLWAGGLWALVGCPPPLSLLRICPCRGVVPFMHPQRSPGMRRSSLLPTSRRPLKHLVWLLYSGGYLLGCACKLKCVQSFQTSGLSSIRLAGLLLPFHFVQASIEFILHSTCAWRSC